MNDVPTGMRKPSVMVSSTCFDLAQARRTLRDFIEDHLGYTSLLSEHPPFPIDSSSSAIENCRRRVENDADVLILIVGHRYGSIERTTNLSITNLEYLSAVSKRIPILAFVHKQVHAALPRWRQDPTQDFSHDVEDPEVLAFVDRLTNAGEGVWIQSFEYAEQIVASVRQQLAYVMAAGLDLQRRLRQAPAWLQTLGGRSLRLAIDRPKGWEYLLFAEQLIFEVDQAWMLQHERVAGMAPGLGEDVSDPSAWGQFRLSDIRRLTATLDDLINRRLPIAFGEPGVPGDPEAIAFVARSLSELYRTLHLWRRKVMTANVDERLARVIPLMGKFVDDALTKLETMGPLIKGDVEAAMALPEGHPGRIVSRHFSFTANTEEFMHELSKV